MDADRGWLFEAHGEGKQSQLLFSHAVLRITFRGSRGSQSTVRRRFARPAHAEGRLRKVVFTNRRYRILMQLFILLTSLKIPPN
jgi:hypothetical protein